MSDRPDDDEEYKRIFGLISEDDQIAFRVFFINSNTEAYDDTTKTASDWFVSFDVLEDAMPFLSLIGDGIKGFPCVPFLFKW